MKDQSFKSKLGTLCFISQFPLLQREQKKKKPNDDGCHYYGIWRRYLMRSVVNSRDAVHRAYAHVRHIVYSYFREQKKNCLFST